MANREENEARRREEETADDLARGGINSRNERGDTPLHQAVTLGNLTWGLRRLISLGADVNARNNHGDTVLFLALASFGHSETQRLDAVRILIDAGANVNDPTSSGITPLQASIVHGHTECVNLLIGAGADINAVSSFEDQPLLSVAESAAVVETLIRSGADIQAQDKFGDTPLVKFIQRGNLKAAQLLIDAGADPRVTTTGDGNSLLWAAVSAGEDKAIRFLIGLGLDPNAESPNTGDLSPLGIAVKNGYPEAVKALIDAGADVNERSAPQVNRPLHIAHTTTMDRGGWPVYVPENGHEEIQEILLAAGAYDDFPPPGNDTAQGETRLNVANTRRRERCSYCDKVVFYNELDAVDETHRVYALNGEYRRAYHEPRCGYWHVTSQPYAPRDIQAEQEEGAKESVKLLIKAVAGLILWTVALFAVPAFFMIMPVAGGLLSVCISSLFLGETPPTPPDITPWLFGVLSLCVAGRLGAVGVRYGWRGLTIYGVYFLVVTLVGFTGSAFGLIPPLNSWAEDVGDGSVGRTLHLLDPFINAERLASDIGINAEGSLDAAGNWFESFKKEAIGTFAFTFWAILIPEICLAIASIVKYNRNKRKKEEAKRAASNLSTG